jgi:hypothetical protein
MNEQLIGDLFAEATRRMTGSSSREFSQKFAELIVRECVTICNDTNDASYLNGVIAGRKIKQHFGVEE